MRSSPSTTHAERSTRSLVRRLALGSAALFVVLGILLSCVNEPTAPRESAIRYASGLRFNAVFPSLLQQSGTADLVAFNRVRVLLRHSDGTVALDTTIVFPASTDAVSLNLSVRLLPGTPTTGELMTLDLNYLNTANEIVFKGGPVQITAVPSLPGQAPPPPVSIPVVYAGAGAAATAVKISPRTLAVNAGDSFSFTAVGVDASGATVPNTPIFWSSLDLTRATITSPTLGNGKALLVRGSARIVAATITGKADTVVVNIQPVPATIAAVSGSGQTGIVGKPAATTLAQPLVVKVTATDGLPVSGVAVTFAVASGGGSVASAAATTDANGLAQTTWTLGSAPGTQTVTATSGSLAGSPVTFTATAQAAVATKLAITASPAAGTNIAAGATMTIVAVARDVDGDPVSSYGGNVKLSLATSPAGATLGGTTTVAAVGGVATFSNITIGMPGTGYVLEASATGLAAASTPAFNIVTGPATNMVLVTGGGQSAAAGTALSPVTIALTDASGNAKVNVPISFAVTSGGGSVTPATVATDAGGRASATWTLGTTAGTQTLAITSTGVPPLSVSATATSTQSQWVVTQQPLATQTAGANITPAIVAELRNSSNAVVSSFNGTATLSISGNANGAVLGGTATVTAVNGVATFASVFISKSGAAYALDVNSTGSITGTTSAFAVQPAAAATIALQSGNNQTGTFGAALAQPVVAKVTDAFGNGVPAKTVTFTVTAGGGSVTPASLSSDANGLGSTVWTLGASGTQTMSIASSGLAGSPITVSASGGAAPGSLASTVVTPRLDTLTSIGDTKTLVAQGYDASNNVVTGSWTWLSRTPAVATVSAAGLVTSVTNGTAWVVATETGGTKDSAQIVVQQRIASINVTPSSKSIYLGATFTFTAQAVDGRNVAMTSQPVFTWVGVTPSVVSVNASGVATGVAIGSAQIRATSGSAVGVAAVTVLSQIKRVDVTFDSTGATAPDNFTMTSLGQQRMYRAIPRDTLLNPMTGITFAWSSTNASVAAIDSTTATKARATAAANGITTIQATAQGVTGSATLNVAQVLSSIELTPLTSIVAVSGTTSMVARGKDANGRYISGGTFAFTSSAPSIATINASTGVVTGVANGITTITATSGSITSNAATVSVSNSGPAVISFGRDTLGIGRGSSLSVPILLSKPNAAAVTVNLAVADTFAFWSTASVTVAAGQTSVNATLNGRNAGTTRITATDGSGTGYTAASSVLAVQANLQMTTSYYNLNATDQLSTQVLLSDPSPAGGTYVTFAYGTAGRASASPDPAFIPQGQLAADVVIRGVAAGTTTLTPTASGVTGTAATVSVGAPALYANYTTLRLGAGQFQSSIYLYTPNTLYTPLTVALTSSDTNVSTVVPSLTIPAGTNYAYFNINATGIGTANVRATASGWTPDTIFVTSTTPALIACCGTTLNSTAPAQNMTVYAGDSTRTSHQRTNSLAVRWSSSDTTVMRVLDTLVTIAAGQYYNNSGRVIPSGAGGTAWIKATASGHTPDSVQFTVVGPKLTLYSQPVLGAGQEDASRTIQIPNAIATPLVVTLTSSDSSKVATSQTVTISAGSYYQYFTLRGKAVGKATLVATAQGYGSDSAVTVVTTPRVKLTGGTTISTFATTYTQVYSEDSLGSVHNRTAPLTVTLRSTDTTKLKVDTIGTIAAGTYYTQTSPVVTALDSGTAKIIATAPGHLPDTNTWTILQPKLNLSWYSNYIGARQTRQPNDFYVQLPNTRSVPVQVTVTQKQPTKVLVSPTTLTIPASQSTAYLTYSGLTKGGDTVIVSAPGYLPDTGFVTVNTPKFVLYGVPSTATTTQAPTTLTVYAADSTGGFNYTSDTVVMRVVSSDTTVVRPSQPYVSIPKGGYYGSPVIQYVGPGTATITVSDSSTNGYTAMTSNAVTVTGPSLTIYGGNPGMLGMRQNTSANSYYVYTPNNVTAPLTVNLVSTGTRVATVPATVTIPANSNYAYFTITAQDTIGTIQIQATATGYSPTSVNMQVTLPKFILSTSTSLRTTSPKTGITVYPADANGTIHYANENVTVTLASSATGVATIDSATITIPANAYYSNSATWSPVATGTAQLSATDTRAAYYAYGTGTATVSVTTPNAGLSFSTLYLGLGQYSDQNASVPDYTVNPLTVPISHAAVPRSTSPSSVTIPANSYYQPFRITATSVGSDTITLSPSGFIPATGTVVVGLGRIDPISGWPTSLRVGDSVLVTLYTRDQNQGGQSVAATTTFTLAPNANIAFVSGGATSTTITTATVAAGNSYVQFYVKGVTAGTGSATITNANYTTYTNTLTVSP